VNRASGRTLRPSQHIPPTAQTTERLVDSALCAFCGHRNPNRAHFCNECGERLDLTQCWLCEAINARTAAVCHKCNAPLTDPASAGTSIVPQQEVATTVDTEPTRPPARKRLLPGVALATACFVALVAGALYLSTRTEPPPSPPALHETTAPSPAPEAQHNDAVTQVGGAEASPAEDKPASETVAVDAGSAPSNEAATVTQDGPRPTAERRVEKATRARPAPREPNRVARAPSPVLTPPPTTRSNAQPSRRCTDAVAALGLCSLGSSQ
jgi:ribosomal protein L40E